MLGCIGAIPNTESVQEEKNWEEREVQGGKDKNTSKENLASMGDGEQRYWEKN